MNVTANVNWMSLLRRYPVTMGVVAVALLAHGSDLMTASLQLDFALVGQGQWWRLWTGHLTHYDGPHLLWDSMMFAVLGAMCERAHRRTFAAALFVMMAGLSAAIGISCSEIEVYRGLSGIDTGLFVWFASDQIRQSLRNRERPAMFLWVAICGGLIGKLCYEAATGQTLFVEATEFTPLVESHLAGVAIGLLLSVQAIQSGLSFPERLACS